jgi:chemotaxis protein CheC
MSEYFDQMDGIVLDVLKEIGNIGAGNAATALAKMIDKKVDMKVPKVSILEFKEVPELLGGEETQVCGIFFKIEGDINGSIMFLLEMESAFNLIDLLMPREEHLMDEFTYSALQEIGNILSGSYIASLSGLTNLNMHISVPSLCIDMAGAILSVPAIQFGQIGDKILIIENQFIEPDENEAVRGFFFLIPDVESYEILFKSLGVNI